MRDIELKARERGYWSVSDLSELSGLTKERVRQIIAEDKLVANKVGQVWIVPYAAGLKWLNSREEL